MPLSPWARRSTIAFVAVFLGGIAYLTLRPEGGTPAASCLLCSPRGSTDLILNVLLFVPFGAALSALGRRPLAIALTGFAISATIELLQFGIPGRTPSIYDVITNGSGAALGVLLLLHGPSWIARDRWTAWRLWCAALLPAVAVWVTGAMLEPAAVAGPYFAHVAPRVPVFEEWTGTISAARLDSAPVTQGRIEHPVRTGDELLSGMSITVDGLAGRPTGGVAPLLWVTTDLTTEVLMVGAEREDLVVRVRRRAANLLFDAPDSRFDDALAGIPPGAPLAIEVSGPPHAVCATVNGRRTCANEFSAGSLWALLWWQGDWWPSVRRALDALTLLVLTLPLALLLRSVTRTQARAATVVHVVLLTVAAWMQQLRWLALPEAAGVALALLLGVVASQLVERKWGTRSR